MLEPFGTERCPVSSGFSDDGSGVPERHLPSGPDPRSISCHERYHQGIVRYLLNKNNNMQRVMNLSCNIAMVHTITVIQFCKSRLNERHQATLISFVGFASVFLLCLTQTQLA